MTVNINWDNQEVDLEDYLTNRFSEPLDRLNQFSTDVIIESYRSHIHSLLCHEINWLHRSRLLTSDCIYTDIRRDSAFDPFRIRVAG